VAALARTVDRNALRRAVVIHRRRSLGRLFLSVLAALAGCDASREPPPPPAPLVKAAPSPEAMRRWAGLLDAAPSLADRKFYFVMAASAIGLGGLVDVDKEYPAYYSRTMRVGVAVPILYLRTTQGRAADWAFDPDFAIGHKCKARRVAEDSLNVLIRFAIEHKMPVQFILNGGVWANSSCDAPDWDIADHLEQDVDNCQWTQDNKVYPRDHLKNLTGSIDSPELARSLTFNVYATQVRHYKKRNLQEAARRIAAFARDHPDLFIGVSLDADTYMNPFFEQKEWFDYNPGTLRQFREWLRGAGPYAGKTKGGVPDLSAYRREHPLTLADVNRLARQRWTTWDAVEPPRTFPGTAHDALKPGETIVWDDPWYQAWDTFRKHLVGLHYSELSQWVHETGIPIERIYSAQGFIAPGAGMRPFAIRLTSHGQNYDSAGVSIEGAIPRYGHLGAILYGEAALNRAQMEGPHSLLATFARMDANWGVVEFNSTDLRKPDVPPTYAQAYRSLRDFFNFDATMVTVMAWNGSDGRDVGKSGYRPYTAFRYTPIEQAMRDFLITHANLPRGARAWTFGTERHADDDGWSIENGRLIVGNGYLDLELARGTTTLLSPPDQIIRSATTATLIVGLRDPSSSTTLRVFADSGGEWREIAAAKPLSRLAADAAGVHVPLVWPNEWRKAHTIADQLKIEIAGMSEKQTTRLSAIVAYPRADAN
jgi:hypothetical protein